MSNERAPEPAVTTLVVSGKTPERIASMAGALADWMTGAGADVPLVDVAHTLNHHRAQHARFATVCARDRAQAVAGLRALAAGQTAAAWWARTRGRAGPGTVFVYSGQGSQWAGMGRRCWPTSRRSPRRSPSWSRCSSNRSGSRCANVIAESEPVSGDRADPAGADGPAVGADRVVALLRRAPRCGDRPFDGRGHRGGGGRGADRADGLRVIANRSRLMSRLAGQGAMALLELDAEATEALIADYPEVRWRATSRRARP